MAMVYCRSCGKEIHESAPFCPQCGASQAGAGQPDKQSNWLAIVSAILAFILLAATLDDSPTTTDIVVGACLFSAISIGLAATSLHQKRPGRILAIIAITVATISLLAILGNTQ